MGPMKTAMGKGSRTRNEPRKGRRMVAQGASSGQGALTPPSAPLSRAGGRGAGVRGGRPTPRLTTWATFFRPSDDGLTQSTNLGLGALGEVLPLGLRSFESAWSYLRPPRRAGTAVRSHDGSRACFIRMRSAARHRGGANLQGATWDA